jgi:aminopeptidase-like protein
MMALMARVFDEPRSLTGDGVRRTLAAIAERVPVDVTEVPSGAPLFDWTAPDEWTVRAARVIGPDGATVVDAADSPLHLLGYSTAVDTRMTRAELLPHLHSLPARPDAIPFRTSYWERAWGFCVAQRVVDALPEGEYEVLVDADLAPGSMTYGEIVIPGQRPEAVLISTPICHPGLANDNLSGVALLAELGAVLAATGPHRLSYRLLLSPGTVGPLAWLAANGDLLAHVVAGFGVMCVGDAGPITYKRSRRGDTLTDRAAALALRDLGVSHQLRDFSPWGGDERQFCSRGFDLPIGALSRTPPGEYPENHTSDDDLAFVNADNLQASLDAALAILRVFDGDECLENISPMGEPQLGRRGLTRRQGGQKGDAHEAAMLWALSMGDGQTPLSEVAARSGIAFDVVRTAANDLQAAGLLRRSPRA